MRQLWTLAVTPKADVAPRPVASFQQAQAPCTRQNLTVPLSFAPKATLSRLVPSKALRTLMSVRFTERPFRPYAVAIGQAILAWNDLHEHLGRLYGIVLTRGVRTAQLEKWQSSRVDSQKRKWLGNAVNGMEYEPPGWTEELRLYVPWLLAEVSDIEDRRNNAVHVPLHLIADIDVLPVQDRAHFLKAGEVRAHTWAKNMRAQKIAEKALLAEYRACRDAAVDVRDHVRFIGDCVEQRRQRQENVAWPRVPHRLLTRAPESIRDHQARTAWPAWALKQQRESKRQH